MDKHFFEAQTRTIIMTNSVIPFSFNTLEVRTIVKDNGDVWFVASDIAKALDYAVAKDLVRMLDEDERGGHIVPTPSGDQEMTIINESGLYHALIKSRKPEAKPLRKWVTAEVLPTIRKTGSYSVKQPTESPKALPDYRTKLDKAVKHWVAVAQRYGSHLTYSEAWGIVHLRTGMIDGVKSASNEQLLKGFDVVGYALEGIFIPREQAQIEPPKPEPTPQPVTVSDNALMIERMLHNVIPDQMKEVLELLVKFNHHNMQLLSTFTQRSMMTA